METKTPGYGFGIFGRMGKRPSSLYKASGAMLLLCILLAGCATSNDADARDVPPAGTGGEEASIEDAGSLCSFEHECAAAGGDSSPVPLSGPPTSPQEYIAAPGLPHRATGIPPTIKKEDLDTGLPLSA